MVFLTAVRYGVDAAVAYHGGDTKKYLGEADGLHAPLLMHLAEEDEFISKPAETEIKNALADKPNSTVYSYPDHVMPSLSAQWSTLQRRSGKACQRAHGRISKAATSVTERWSTAATALSSTESRPVEACRGSKRGIS
jgi:dienelactone hydrolase